MEGNNYEYYERLYAAYAVRCVGRCSRCGAHIVREGGCSVVTYICGHGLSFRPFQSVEQVNDTPQPSENVINVNDTNRCQRLCAELSSGICLYGLFFGPWVIIIVFRFWYIEI